MAKSAVTDWSTTAADNTDIGGISTAEGVMLPSSVNNAFREIMAQVATAIAAGDFVSFPLSPASASSAGYADFLEDTDNGTNYVRVIAPASVASNKTQTLIDATGLVAVIPAAPGADRLVFWDHSELKPGYAAVTPNVVFSTTNLRVYETWAVALSDETTAITTGTNKATLVIPYAFTVVGVAASLNTVSSSGTPTFDINEGGTTILSTKIVIDVSEKTGGSAGYQGTAVGAAVISDTAIAAFAEIGFDIDVAGTGAKGAKVYLIGYPTPA